MFVQIQAYEAFSAIASVVGNTTLASTYLDKAIALRASVNARFLDLATGVYRNLDSSAPIFNATQCGQSLPFGVKYLLMALADNGRQDLAYEIMTQVDYPSFGTRVYASLLTRKNGLFYLFYYFIVVPQDTC